MFNKQAIPLDTQLNAEQIANMLISEAVQQLMQVTRFSQSNCEAIIAKQFSQHGSMQHSSMQHSSTKMAAQTPLLDSKEQAFIQTLF